MLLMVMENQPDLGRGKLDTSETQSIGALTYIKGHLNLRLYL